MRVMYTSLKNKILDNCIMTSINIINPLFLAAYFGYPSLINGSGGNISLAVNEFKIYDQIILGTGLQLLSHDDHFNSVSIISDSEMKDVQVFGYVESTDTPAVYQENIDLWKDMGVKGICCMNFDYSAVNTRAHQNDLVNYIHSKDLVAMVSSWDPDNVFSSAVDATFNPLGVAPVIGANDWFLAQSYQIVFGTYQNETDWVSRSNKLKTYTQTFGSKIACLTTTDDSPFDQNKFDYSYFSTLLYNFHAHGWGELYYSAASSQLPPRERKTFYGQKFLGNITVNGGIYQRKAKVGIYIDTNTHDTDIILQ